MRNTRKEIPDSGAGCVRGLYLVEQVSGKKSWAYRYRFAGKPTKFTIGACPEISRKDARILAMKAIYDRAQDIDPAAKRRELRAANMKAKPLDIDKVETVTAQFLKRHCANLKPSTQAEAARYMTKITSAWRGRALSSIGKAEIHSLLDSIMDSGSPIAANRTLAWLGNLFNFAIQRGILASNPCAGIARPSAEVARARILSDDELRAVLAAADGLESPYSAFVRLLALTGQRRNEVSCLSWQEINFDAKTWVLPGSRAKNRQSHEIPLSDAAIEILQGLLRFIDCPFVFTRDGRNAIHAHDLVKKAIDKAAPGISHWTLHDIRRTFATGLARLGVELPVVERLLNHTGGSFSGIVGVYQKFDFADKKRRAMTLWSEHIARLMAGEPDNVVPMRGRS